jgi:DNA-binding transcriptional regulator LsrR (DeoR family)
MAARTDRHRVVPARTNASNEEPKAYDVDQPPTLVSDVPGVGDATIMAAWLYYHEGMTQAEVAEVLKVSRPSVANMLARARELGVVQISVRPDYLASLELSQRMRTHFGLQQVVVVPTPGAGDALAVQRSLGKAGAMYLESAVQPGEILVTAWGATMLEVALALRRRPVPGLRIAQSLGGVSTADHFNPTRVAGLMGEKLEARVYHLYVPCVVESREVRDILMRDRGIYSAFEVARSGSRAMIGIGKVASDATVVRAGFMSALQMEALRARGAVGDMMGRFFDIEGRPVESELNDRIMALTFDDLQRIKPVIAVAGGADKIEAVLGAIRGPYIDVLIIDERTASAVLEADRSRSGDAPPRG